jgi:hypothetical protein
MATSAQIQANRENAKKSTGPQSEAGREASSRNAFRHGLSGHLFALLEWESAENFDALKAALEQEHKPATPTEQILVEKMVQHYWLTQRCVAMQTAIMRDIVDEGSLKAIDTYIRYQTHHQRQFDKALAALLKLRAEMRKAEIGFVSQKHAEAQETRRAAAENRKAEVHAVTMEIKTQRLEREKYNLMMAATKAGDKIVKELPPKWQELAA